MLYELFGLFVTEYQALVTLQPDWCPFNSLGADVVNNRKYKTGLLTSHNFIKHAPIYRPTLLFYIISCCTCIKMQHKSLKI